MSDKPKSIREIVETIGGAPVYADGYDKSAGRLPSIEWGRGFRRFWVEKDALITALEKRESAREAMLKAKHSDSVDFVQKHYGHVEEERDRLAMALSEANRRIGELCHAAKLALEELDTEYVGGREETQEAAQKALRLALRASAPASEGAFMAECCACGLMHYCRAPVEPAG